MASDAGVPATNAKTKKGYDRWEISDAMHTLMRAGEIVRDKKLMEEVKKHAGEKASEMKMVARQAGQLAKAGRISPKAMAKLGAR